MRKTIFTLSVLATSFTFAQSACCNVADNAGVNVVTKDMTCVVAPNLYASSCTTIADRDKDGVADNEDLCPDVYGTAKNNGCPKVDKTTKKALESALTGVQFENNSDQLKDSSYPALDAVADALKAHEEYNLKIEGYTDNVGDDNYNKNLSERRAITVKNYLINKSISESRLNAAGYGEEKPVASNETEEGRAKNRRVEFKVFK